MVRNVPKGQGLRVRNHLRAVPATVEEVTKSTAAADVPTAEACPPVPRSFEGDQDLCELWDDIVPDLARAGVVSRIDRPALELMIRHFHAARLASEDLNLGEPTVLNEKTQVPMKNPAETVFRVQSLSFLAYAKECGMTFASSANLRPTPPGGDGGNPFIR